MSRPSRQNNWQLVVCRSRRRRVSIHARQRISVHARRRPLCYVTVAGVSLISHHSVRGGLRSSSVSLMANRPRSGTRMQKRLMKTWVNFSPSWFVWVRLSIQWSRLRPLVQFLKVLSKDSFRPLKGGQELLATQHNHRSSSWRSFTCIRGSMIEAAEIRCSLNRRRQSSRRPFACCRVKIDAHLFTLASLRLDRHLRHAIVGHCWLCCMPFASWHRHNLY